MSTEEFKIDGEQLLARIRELIQQGNVRRIIIKNEKGVSVFEIPVTVGAIGAAFAPMLVAVGAVAALLTKCSIVVERI